jgi:predicted O-linked N-acetylglucosamine transferase (SPINDLY family)
VLESFLALTPTSLIALNTLGVMLSENGETKAAIEKFQSILHISPEHIEAQSNLGLALLNAGADMDAKKILENALRQVPQSPELHGNLATVYRRQGNSLQAAKLYKAAIALRPDPIQMVRLATLFPIIPASRQAIEDARDVFENSIDRLVQDKIRLTDAVRDIDGVHFYLTFHDADNRQLFEKVSNFYRSACPSLNYTSPHCQRPEGIAGRKIRVGFVSRYFRNHAVGWCYSGMLRFISKDRLSITAITFGGGEDEVWRSIANDVDATMILPMNLVQARERIAAAQFDVLFYTDIGMEPFTYFLAFSRLAPVQCVTNGHPDTTGISTLDYFISDEHMSPSESSSKYSETLVNLPGVVAYYQRPEFPKNLLTRDALGLPEDKTIYLCPQSLFKIHPDMDFWFRDILAADKNGVIVIFEGPCSDWSRLLLKRFCSVLGSDVDRILTLPRLPYESFLRVLTHSDVILDTWPFGGGNTSHQAIAAGIPVVTMPSEFARGRVTFSLYQTMNMTDAIVATKEEYADLAVQFGTDRDKRLDFSAALVAKSSMLFGDTGSLSAYEEFLYKSAVGTV